MRSVATFLLFFFSGLYASGQAILFEKIFGAAGFTNKGVSVKQDAAGFIYFLGENDSLGNFDLVLTKMKPDGQILWTHSYGTANTENASSLSLTKDGQLIFTGSCYDPFLDKTKGWVVKTDTAGQVIWQKYIEDPVKNLSLHYIETAHDSGFVACGYITQSTGGANDGYIVKLDSAGSKIWERKVGFFGNDYAQRVKKTPDGGYIVSADAEVTGASYDNYVVKLTAGGFPEWDLTIGDQYANGNQDIWVGADGYYYLSGESPTQLGAAFDVYLAKVSFAGDLAWAKYIGYTGTDAGFSLVPSDNEHFLISGYSGSYAPSSPVNVMIARVDTSGQPTGVNYFPQPAVGIGYEIIPDISGNYLVAGFTGTQFYLLHARDTGYTDPFSNGFSVLPEKTSVFIAYPNPAKEAVHVSIAGNDKLFNWELLDVKGTSIRTGTGNGELFDIALTGIVPGYYILRIRIKERTLTEPLLVR
jgi:hypothetical protein